MRFKVASGKKQDPWRVSPGAPGVLVSKQDSVSLTALLREEADVGIITSMLGEIRCTLSTACTAFLTSFAQTLAAFLIRIKLCKGSPVITQTPHAPHAELSKPQAHFHSEGPCGVCGCASGGGVV